MEPKPIPYHDLIRVLQPGVETASQGCPICQLVTESVPRYLDDLIFFSAVKPDTRAEIRAARGFCNEHASQLAQLTGKGLGVALIHEDIIDTVMEGLAQCSAAPDRASEFAGRIALSDANPVHATGVGQRLSRCWRRRDRAWRASTSFWSKRAISARSGAILTRRRSPPRCAPRPACACPICGRRFLAAPDADALRRLIEIQIECLGRLRAELRELTRKFDHRFKHEVIGAEGDAWLRSIAIVSGKRGIR